MNVKRNCYKLINNEHVFPNTISEKRKAPPLP